GLHCGGRGAVFEIRSRRLRVKQALGRFEWMKIGIGDADVPGNEAIRTDLDLFLGHDQRPVQQSQITDRALAVLADRKRASRVTGNVFADDDCARYFASKLSKNLRALAINAAPS